MTQAPPIGAGCQDEASEPGLPKAGTGQGTLSLARHWANAVAPVGLVPPGQTWRLPIWDKQQHRRFGSFQIGYRSPIDKKSWRPKKGIRPYLAGPVAPRIVSGADPAKYGQGSAARLPMRSSWVPFGASAGLPSLGQPADPNMGPVLKLHLPPHLGPYWGQLADQGRAATGIGSADKAHHSYGRRDAKRQEVQKLTSACPIGASLGSHMGSLRDRRTHLGAPRPASERARHVRWRRVPIWC